MRWESRSNYRYKKSDDIITILGKINKIDNLQEWLKPSKSSCHSSYLLQNIEQAVERILHAVDYGEKISVFLDVDADGITAGVIMYRYLLNYTTNIDYFFNQRDEGHGIEYALNKIPEGTNLLIIVDSSTNSVNACSQIKELGIDIVVIDHHHKEVTNPYVTLVNNQTCDYPNKELSGAGLAYKVCEVMDDKIGVKSAIDYIDLAGVGIHADVMSVTEPENRYYISQALKNMNNMGLNALLRVTNSTELNTHTLAFNISPIINATARLNQIEIIIQLLLSDDLDECNRLARKCYELNQLRKKKQDEITKKLELNLDNSKKILIVFTEDNNKSFNGLVANQLANKYGKPCLVVFNDFGTCKGSGRSIGNFKLKEFLEQSNLFNYVQGHSQSFGLEFSYDLLSEIEEYINKSTIEISQNKNVTYYDIEVNSKDITTEFIEKINQFNYITGKNYSATKFLIPDFFVGEREVIGKNKDTIKLTGENLVAMKFKTHRGFAEETEWEEIEIVGTLSINKFYHRGKGDWITTNQLIIEDYKLNSLKLSIRKK